VVIGTSKGKSNVYSKRFKTRSCEKEMHIFKTRSCKKEMHITYMTHFAEEEGSSEGCKGFSKSSSSCCNITNYKNNFSSLMQINK
jgi:hypothetical protein